MPHIHTNPGDHDHTASAFLFRIDGDEPRVILHMHKKLGRLLQFGGHVEVQETPWQAVAHELTEESGYELTQCRLLQPKLRIKHLTDVIQHPVPLAEYTHRFSKIHSHIDRGYVLVTTEEPKHDIAPNESQDIRMLTRAELVRLGDDVIVPNVREVALFVMDEILSSDQWEAVDPLQFAL